MSELSAFLADHALEHVERPLADAGVTLINEIFALDAEALGTVGIDADSVARLLAALSVSFPQPPPRFQWQPSES